MHVTNRTLARGIFGALVAGALCFGATNALASPPVASAGCMHPENEEFCANPYCTVDDEVFCMEGCREAWGGNKMGYCTFWMGTYKMCACYD